MVERVRSLELLDTRAFVQVTHFINDFFKNIKIHFEYSSKMVLRVLIARVRQIVEHVHWTNVEMEQLAMKLQLLIMVVHAQAVFMVII